MSEGAFACLGPDSMRHIFGYLGDFPDVLSTGAVCRAFKAIMADTGQRLLIKDLRLKPEKW
jgi:hypothetical protein